MLLKSLILKSTFLALSAFLLCHCTPVIDKHAAVAGQLQATPYTLPAASYLAMANHASLTERQTMLLMAAGKTLFDGNYQAAEDILAQTSDLTLIQSDEKAILMANIYLMKKQPRKAIVRLSTVKQRQHLPTFYQRYYHNNLAQAYEATGNAIDSVVERIKLDGLLPDEASRIENGRILWLTLSRLPPPELDTLATEAQDNSLLQGWARLALIPNNVAGSKKNILADIKQWQAHYSSHPANAFLSAHLSSVTTWLHGTPKHMALLLPLSGPLAGPGGAIRDGFMAAYNASLTQHDVSVRWYDTASADAVRLYQQALADGADYVVGPLTKTDVLHVAAVEHPVPTLLLNDIESGSKNAYGFGLSPVSEARQVAIKARQQGLQQALVIAPAGAWGNDIVAAFASEWKQQGGHVRDTFRFDNKTDLSQGMRQFLGVSERAVREKPLPSAKHPIASAAKRRQDFDMIFLLAYPSQARSIMPLIKYYFAENIPVYATSAVYAASTNTLRDRDLDGIIFCDMPWIFKHPLANKPWPEQLNSYSRLYALGMDSYALAAQLNQLLLFPAMGIHDKSGILYLNQKQQVDRVLAWGRFKHGVAQPIEASFS